MILLTLFAVAVTATILYWKKCNNYWKNAGVPQTNPNILFGNSFKLFFQLIPLTDFVTNLYYQVRSGMRYLGFYQFLKPTLLISNPELIKQITIKDFDHFTDHMLAVSAEADPLFGSNLFSLNGKKWHDMRIAMSPSFTSSKMRFIYSLIHQTADDFVKHFIKKNEDSLELDMKDAFSRVTNDVIASSAFGVKVNSLEDEHNEFFTMGKKTTNLTGFWVTLKFFLSIVFPKVCKFLGLRVLGNKTSKYFHNIIDDTIRERRDKNIVRKDVIHLLLEAQKGQLKQEEEPLEIDTGFATVQEELTKKSENTRTKITDLDIAAQAMIFFFAGFDGVSTLMCFTAYELAENPDIQAKLRDEINEAFEKSDENITYEALLKMDYLDMVISECLRKWPNAIAADRLCTKPYTIEPTTPSEKAVHLRKGDAVWIPIYALHRDPKYFPDPERFDPERFNDENKSSINPYTYLPFGIGPRNCIGSRFALLETKAVIAHLVRHFEITLSAKMQLPLVIDKKALNIRPEGGFWMKLNRLRN